MMTKSLQILFLSVSHHLAALSYENAKPVFFPVVHCACIIAESWCKALLKDRYAGSFLF